MTAEELLTVLFNAGIAISVIATVMSLGMSFTLSQLIAPLRRVTLVLAMVVLNALIIPAAAWGIAEVSPMDDKYVAGLVLAVIGAGGAASLKAAQLVKRADLPLAVSVVVVLQLVDIIAVPVWAGQVVSGASISAWDVVKNLLVLVLLPLAIGLVVRARYVEHAGNWRADLVRIANLALAIALVSGVAANWTTIKSMFGSWVVVTALMIIAVATILGALPGAKSAEVRLTTGLVSSLRFSSPGADHHRHPARRGPDLLGPGDHLCAGGLRDSAGCGYRNRSSSTCQDRRSVEPPCAPLMPQLGSRMC